MAFIRTMWHTARIRIGQQRLPTVFNASAAVRVAPSAEQLQVARGSSRTLTHRHSLRLPAPALQLRLNDVGTALALGNAPAGALKARGASSAATTAGAAELTETEFHEAADALLEAIECTAGALDDTITEGFDLSHATGVLTLKLGPKGTYVLNKQAPNRQIWWSSPLSGPKRYHWDASRRAWLNTRDGHELTALLTTELERLTGQRLAFVTRPG